MHRVTSGWARVEANASRVGRDRPPPVGRKTPGHRARVMTTRTSFFPLLLPPPRSLLDETTYPWWPPVLSRGRCLRQAALLSSLMEGLQARAGYSKASFSGPGVGTPSAAQEQPSLFLPHPPRCQLWPVPWTGGDNLSLAILTGSATGEQKTNPQSLLCLEYLP